MIEGRKKEMVIGNTGYSRVGMEAALWRENILKWTSCHGPAMNRGGLGLFRLVLILTCIAADPVPHFLLVICTL